MQKYRHPTKSIVYSKQQCVIWNWLIDRQRHLNVTPKMRTINKSLTKKWSKVFCSSLLNNWTGLRNFVIDPQQKLINIHWKGCLNGFPLMFINASCGIDLFFIHESKPRSAIWFEESQEIQQKEQKWFNFHMIFWKKLNFARIFNSKFRRSLCEDVLYLCAWLRKKKRITCKNGTNLQKCINKMQIRSMIIMYTLDGFLWHCNANSFFIFISICNFVP